MDEATTPGAPPAAGWYPDGTGMLRYWDGNQWTVHQAPIPEAAAQDGVQASMEQDATPAATDLTTSAVQSLRNDASGAGHSGQPAGAAADAGAGVSSQGSQPEVGEDFSEPMQPGPHERKDPRESSAPVHASAPPHALGAPSVSEGADESQVGSKGQKVAIGAGVVLAVAAVGVGVYFGVGALTGDGVPMSGPAAAQSGAEDADDGDLSPFSGAPTVVTFAEVSGLGSDFDLMPLGPQGQAYLDHGEEILVGIQNAETRALVAINPDSQTAYPAWQWTFPQGSDCEVTSSAVDCGGDGTYSITDVGPVPVLPKSTIRPVGTNGSSPNDAGSGEEATDTAPDQTAGTNHSDQESAGQDDAFIDKEEESDPSDTVPDDGPDGTQAGETDDEAETPLLGNDDENDPDLDQSGSDPIQVTEQPTHEFPYAIIGSSLVDEEGSDIATDLSAGEYWALRDDADTWVVSNGQTLIVIQGGEILWQRELPAGSVKVNGFDRETGPTWALSGGILLIGTPESVLALDVQTGKEGWRVDTEVTSWETTETTLLISTGTRLITLSYPDPEIVTGGNEPQSGERTTLVLGEETEAVILPTAQEIGNSELTVPDAEVFAYLGSDLRIQLENGMAGVGGQADSHGVVHRAQVIGYPVLDGRPYILLQIFTESTPGHSVDVLVLYDAQMVPVDFIEYQDTAQVWQNHGSWFDNVEIRGSTLEATKFDVEDRNVSATSTYVWDGGQYVLTDTVYHTPNGDSRAVSLEDVRFLYDQLATGNEDVVSENLRYSVTDFDMSELDGAAIPGSYTIREFYFPAGGQVVDCLRRYPEYGPPVFSDGNTIMGEARMETGDFICAVSDPNRGVFSLDESEGGPGAAYPITMTIRGDENGTPYLVDVVSATG